jgi:branched-chain amino acid transport system substrate-binding protein
MTGRFRKVWWLLLALVLVAAACAAPGGEEAVSGEELEAETEAEEAATAGGSEAEESEPAGSGEPIRVGFIASTTGTAASSGEDMVRGWELYWQQNGPEVAGRTIEYEVVDDGGDPAVGLTQAQRLVEQEDVQLVVGPLFANVGLAVAEYLSQQGVPNFQQVASADDLTQRSPLEGVLRVGGWTSSQTSHVAGQYAYDQGYRRMVTLCSDYAFGHENCGGFVNTFTDAGGEVIEQLWAPLGTQDFSTYIAQLQQLEPDAVYVLGVGGDSVRFVDSWASFGLRDEIPLIGGETLLDQSLLRNMNPDAAEGLISVGKFAEGRDEPGTQEFVEAFLAEYDDLPSYYAQTSYTAARWTAEALEAVDGDIEDTEAFLEAVRAVELDDTAGGPMRLDEYDNPIQNVYVREVQRRDDGRLWNVPVETFEEVSQFWEYDPEEFLDHPVYSREYQGDGVWPEPAE